MLARYPSDGDPLMWMKLSDDFYKDCRRAKLTDAAFRVHVEMLCFAMDDENGGAITWDDITSISRAQNIPTAVEQLVAVEFWARTGDETWQIIHQMEHQPDVEVLTKRREQAAERQRKKRRKAIGLDSEGTLSRRDSPRDEVRDDPRDPGRGWSGRYGESQETNPALEQEANGRRSQEPSGW